MGVPQFRSLILGTKFQFKQTILSFRIKFSPKWVFPVENRKGENHHCVLCIRITLGTKPLLKLTISIFLTKFAGKCYWPSKIEKSHFYVCQEFFT